MERLLKRLREAAERQGEGPPFRLTEFAQIIGYSLPTVRKMIDAGAVETVGVTDLVEAAKAGEHGLMDERRIPAAEALRVARTLKII